MAPTTRVSTWVNPTSIVLEKLVAMAKRQTPGRPLEVGPIILKPFSRPRWLRSQAAMAAM